MQKFLAIILFVCLSYSVFAQGEIDTTSRIFYRNEKTFHAALNSNGLGLNYRYAKRINYFDKTIYEVEFNNIKHIKEYKITNPFVPNNRSYVYGKLNNFWNFSAGRGFQRMIFEKRDVGGIAIRYFYSYGVSLGVLKPIYYEVLYPTGISDFQIEIEKFNTSIHNPGEIMGRASFFKGFNEISFAPGAYAKAGVNIEYSKEDILVRSLEVGFKVDAFTREIPIMAGDNNDIIFLTMFVGYRFGRIINPYEPDSETKRKAFRLNFGKKEEDVE